MSSGATLGMSKTYNSNSLHQNDAIQYSIDFIQEAIDVLDVPSVNIIADFGSSQGLNSNYVMKVIIDYLRKTKKYVGEPLVVHNDLPTNDWTSLFQLLIKDNSYNGVAGGRSFYEQCLPNNSLAIGYSSSSLHWLSKKPCNISNHCAICFHADLKEHEAFKHQSYLDYEQFLECRSRELIPGGVLVLSIFCTDEQVKYGNENLCDILYKCAQLLPLTSQELLEFTFPIYCRSYEECLDEKLFTKYSFQLVKSKAVSIFSSLFKQWKEEQITFEEFVRLNTSFIQGWTESILQQVLMNNGRTKEDISRILNQFWDLCKEKTREQPDLADFYLNHMYIILKKK